MPPATKEFIQNISLAVCPARKTPNKILKYEGGLLCIVPNLETEN
jgi:hypothetical protein